MPQFNVQDLEDNNIAKQQLNKVLNFLNEQLDSTTKPNSWSLSPQDADQFFLELKNDPQHIDHKLEDFITWCYIIIFNTKKLRLSNKNHLLQLSKEKYQCNTLTKPQRININALYILRAALVIFSFVLYGLGVSNKFKSKRNGQLITLMISNAFVVSYIRQQLIKEYQLENRNTQEGKNNAFLTWLSKISEYIPAIQLKTTTLSSAISNNNTPNLTTIYRRRLSDIDLASQDKTAQGSASSLKQTLQ